MPFLVFVLLAPFIAAVIIWLGGTALLFSDNFSWRTPIGTAAMTLAYSPLIYIVAFPATIACAFAAILEILIFNRRPGYLGAGATALAAAIIYIGRTETLPGPITICLFAHLIPALICTRINRLVLAPSALHPPLPAQS